MTIGEIKKTATEKMAKSVEALKHDLAKVRTGRAHTGLIDHLRAIRGVIVAVFFEELADGKVRVSVRSKSDAVDVCAICQKFGGGGHTAAAGARVRGTLAEVEEKVLEEIGDVLKSNS